MTKSALEKINRIKSVKGNTVRARKEREEAYDSLVEHWTHAAIDHETRDEIFEVLVNYQKVVDRYLLKCMPDGDVWDDIPERFKKTFKIPAAKNWEPLPDDPAVLKALKKIPELLPDKIKQSGILFEPDGITALNGAMIVHVACSLEHIGIVPVSKTGVNVYDGAEPIEWRRIAVNPSHEIRITDEVYSKCRTAHNVFGKYVPTVVAVSNDAGRLQFFDPQLITTAVDALSILGAKNLMLEFSFKKGEPAILVPNGDGRSDFRAVLMPKKSGVRSWVLLGTADALEEMA